MSEADHSVESETTQGEAMTSEEVVQITPRPVAGEESSQEGALQVREQPLAMVWNRPIMPSKDIDVAETYSVAGVRPIAASEMHVAATFLANRPIATSNLKVYEILPGDRPVFYSDIKYLDGLGLPGDRPVMVSHPSLMSASTLPGGRPIAPNDIVDDEAPVLMGYLD